jgi:hypothetical protein
VRFSPQSLNAHRCVAVTARRPVARDAAFGAMEHPLQLVFGCRSVVTGYGRLIAEKKKKKKRQF